MDLGNFTDDIYDKLMDNGHTFDINSITYQWVNRDHGVIRLYYEKEPFFIRIEKCRRKDLLNYFSVNNFDELANNAKFRKLLDKTCKEHNGKLISWRPTRTGFLLIMEHQMLKFSLIKDDLKCVQSSLLYS